MLPVTVTPNAPVFVVAIEPVLPINTAPVPLATMMPEVLTPPVVIAPRLGHHA